MSAPRRRSRDHRYETGRKQNVTGLETTSLAAAVRCLPAPPAKAAVARLRADLAGEGETFDALGRLFAAHPQLQKLTAAFADYSPFLWRLVTTKPERFLALAEAPPDEVRARILADVKRAGEEAQETSDIMRRLRRLRAEFALFVALCDCGGVWDLPQVTRALSDFADACVAAAVTFLLREAREAGRLVAADGDGPGFVVLALGKHGARELNYSSDIDLVVFFDPEAPLREGLEPAPFFVRLTQGLVKILQERTGDGYVFRVDLRLRPDPGSTAVAVSLPAAFSYYESVGQNWERAAFIKARPVAGDIALGERFLADLRPFVWRKYFDFATIADIHAMKRQIHAVRGHEAIAVAGHDIKLGRGGIREIEFFVQTQQLVFGGRRPSLRGRRTLEVLDALVEEKWITPEARDDMAAAYVFLRTVEHRLQMVADEQTQRLPEDPEALARVARFCGFATVEAFGKALTAHARKVQGHYAMLFEEGPELAAEAGSLVFTGTGDDPETLETLRRLGFADPPRVAETVRGWHFGRRAAVTSARAREVLTELTPALLTALGQTAAPDAALAALDEAFGRMPAAVELLSILRSNERLLRLFADLLGGAPRLAEVVSAGPHVLDAVIDPTFLDPTTDEAAIEARLRSLVGTPAGYEDFLDRLREAVRQENFLVGARFLSDILSPPRAGEAFAAVAQAAVRLSLDAAQAAFAEEHGRVPDGRAVVLGLGRLGAREMTATSDLDLVVIYDFDPDNRESDGRRPLDAVVYYSRLTQRLVSALTVPTRRGGLYEVDMRLRPSGRKGPVATQFDGFLAYQRTEAETWEHMALTRARVIAGDPSLAAEVEEAIASVLRESRDREKLAADIRDMRALIAQEKGDDPGDLKLAAGGLVDIEFIAQFLILAHAAEEPALIVPGTAHVLARAAEKGILPPGRADVLRPAYDLLSSVFQWQRLTVEGRFDPKTVAPAIQKRIATAVGLPDQKVLARTLDDTRRQVRTVFNELLGAGDAGKAHKAKD